MADKPSIFWLIMLAAILGLVALVSWPMVRYGYDLEDTTGCLITMGHNSTRYAPRYSEAALGRVQLGMTRKEVDALLGGPLLRYTWMETNECWKYTEAASRSGHHHNRVIVFSEQGRVQEIYKCFYFD